MNVTISSTAWQKIEVDAICNYTDDIKEGERTFDNEATCYTKKVEMQITSKSWSKLYEMAKHIESDCDFETCKYCQLED